MSAVEATAGPETPSEARAGASDLPPGHPAIAPGTSAKHAGRSPHGVVTPLPNEESPAITWSAPSTWENAPNPNAMRIATYHVPEAQAGSEAAEAFVARAGGTPAANIDRWVGQFTITGKDIRSDIVVHGLKVHVVQVEGTYVSGGMMTGTAPASHPEWALVGAVVETDGSPYFFKLTGPRAAVLRARPAFDAWIASIKAS
jgi:hypothetical protein